MLDKKFKILGTQNANDIGTKSTNNCKSPGPYQEVDKHTNLDPLGYCKAGETAEGNVMVDPYPESDDAMEEVSKSESAIDRYS